VTLRDFFAEINKIAGNILLKKQNGPPDFAQTFESILYSYHEHITQIS
jgi:hypothetical protein